MAAHAVGCYLPMADEVDTLQIIERSWRAQKRIFVPVIADHDTMSFVEVKEDTIIERNEFGIWEPMNGVTVGAMQLDIVITPVVAFDRQHHRIGMGGGYYDRCFRFLKNRRKWLRPKLIGVAFTCQEISEVSPRPWDVSLYSVVTNTNKP